MIVFKSPAEIELMRRAGFVVWQALERVGIRAAGAEPSFKGYHGYPASICVSVNEQVIHGIPGDRKLAEGDIVSVDVGAVLDGYHGDSARTPPLKWRA